MDSIILLSKKVCLEKILDRDFLVVEWLRLHLPMLGVGRAKIPHALWAIKPKHKTEAVL